MAECSFIHSGYSYIIGIGSTRRLLVIKSILKTLGIAIAYFSIVIGMLLAGIATIDSVVTIYLCWGKFTTLVVGGLVVLFIITLAIVYTNRRITWLEREVKRRRK